MRKAFFGLMWRAILFVLLLAGAAFLAPAQSPPGFVEPKIVQAIDPLHVTAFVPDIFPVINFDKDGRPQTFKMVCNIIGKYDDGSVVIEHVKSTVSYKTGDRVKINEAMTEAFDACKSRMIDLIFTVSDLQTSKVDIHALKEKAK